MKKELLQARIKILKENGSPIGYFYDRESFNLLNIPLHAEEDSQFIEFGKLFEYEGQKYEVKKINFKMEENYIILIIKIIIVKLEFLLKKYKSKNF